MAGGNAFRILARGPDWVAVDKPAGFVAHRLEDSAHSVPQKLNGMIVLREQLGVPVFPVHRLDRATSGVLLYALTAERAREFQALWKSRTVRKAYVALVRGWMREPIDCTRALSTPGSQRPLEARTQFAPIAHAELAHSIGEFATTRVSLVWAFPQTGRFHQIRRHLAHLAHPILGDSVHGDGRANRVARAQGWQGLFLKAYALSWPGHAPIVSRWGKAWHPVFDALGVCPAPSGSVLWPFDEGMREE